MLACLVPPQVTLALYVYLGASMLLQIEALLGLLLLPLAEGRHSSAAPGHGPGAAELQQVRGRGAFRVWGRAALLIAFLAKATRGSSRGRHATSRMVVVKVKMWFRGGNLAAPMRRLPPQVALEGVLDFCAQPGFVRDAYLNLDCRCAGPCCCSLAVPAGEGPGSLLSLR